MKKATDGGEDDDRATDEETFESSIGDRSPSEAVVDVVSAIRNDEPTELSPLYRAVDPEALDALYVDADATTRPTVEFDYEGFLVTVRPTGTVAVVES